ncbi:hypothetical protein FDENT_13158 [Fusarium denticulatum]|uniref:Uncharacterized protein n=1 Tax=Fusarium denticulatum TaxID=48507 RepID=A0A8H5T663_9HYPO|nr:hypothetical protein FDENT_13158 [Fusarium denticulatum]
MSNTQEKRASEPHEDEPSKKRGRPSRADLNSKAPENSTSRVQARAMLGRHPRVRYSDQEESSFYDGLVPWPEKYEWSVEDADAVEEEWKNSAIRKCSEDLNTSQYRALFLLFKISLRLYRTTPVILFSPVCVMRYQTISKNPTASKWIPSAGFCDTLSSIMVHPCWEENIDSLALALRWTVICRRDSRYRWTNGVKSSCPVVQRTIEKVEGYGSRPLDTSYHDMHNAERERALDRGESLSSLSDILYELGEVVRKDKTKRPKVVPEFEHIFGWSVLPVTTRDLDVLVKVVDSMNFKSEWNYSVEEALAAWKAEISGNELPPLEKLSDAYKYSHKSIFRYVRLFAREVTSVPVTEEADDFQSSDPYSDDNGPQQTSPLTPHTTRRPNAVDGSSDVKSESGSENSGPLQLRHRRGDEEEESTTIRPDDYDFSLHTRDEDEDHRMTDNPDGASLGFGDFRSQATGETDILSHHGTVLNESRPARPPESPMLEPIREKKMISELSELRKENKELRDGQKRLQDLFTESLEGQKAQKELMFIIKQQLDSVQSELSQLRQAKETPTQDGNVQSHPETPILPDVAVTASGDGPQSPELGTSPPSSIQLRDVDVPDVWRTAHGGPSETATTAQDQGPDPIRGTKGGGLYEYELLSPLGRRFKILKGTNSTQVFVLTGKEQRIFSSCEFQHMPKLLLRDQTTDHTDFCSILEWCRVEHDSPERPCSWVEGGEDLWKCEHWLPKRVLIVFSLDPWMSAACALALTGLIQWACDMAKRDGANMRVLTFSNFFGNSLLSELVSLRSQQPVEHFELPIPTRFNLIPEVAIDLTPEDHVYSTIQARMSPLNAQSRNAVLLAHDVRYQYLLMKHVDENGESMSWSPANCAPGFGRTATVIQVDLEHPIPDILHGFERVHIVLGKRCTRRVFDEATKQVVKTELSITQSELDSLRWWCFRLNNPFPYLRIYAGSESLRANEDAAVYRPLHIMNHHVGAFISGVYGMSSWGIDPERVVGCFMKSTPVIAQVTSFLRKEGVIHGRLPRLAFTGSEEAWYRAILRAVGHDYRIAHFCALRSPDVKTGHFGSDVPAFGWGSNFSNHGDLWQVLGMWKAIALNSEEFDGITPTQELVWDASGYLKPPIGAVQHFHATNHSLQNALNDLDIYIRLPLCRIEDETESLNDDQMREVLQHLLRAFQHQLIVTRLAIVQGQEQLKHTVVSTGTGVEMRSRRTVLPLSNAIFKNVQRGGILYGICTEFIKEAGSLVALNWTWIPHDLVAQFI